MSNTEYVVLVDEHDREVGTMEKLQAHVDGRLHRALSVFVFNAKNELLLQRRADGKYHSGGLWTNTCCSHPRQGEEVHDAARRRLKEEMGLQCDLYEAFSFVYKASFANGLTEYEFDHVFKGVSDTPPEPDPGEVGGWSYMTMMALEADMAQRPDAYTEWFKICIKDHREQIFG